MQSEKRKYRQPGLVFALLWVTLSAATCFAHPMGNFSVNHYAKISVGQQSIEILYLVDMAEIPTYQEIRQFDITAKADDPSVARYLDRQEPVLKAGLSLEIDGEPVQLDAASRRVVFAEGAGGLPTMKIGFVFRGKITGPADAHKLLYVDNNFPGHAGWKEIVVRSDGAEVLTSSAPSTDRSQELTNYSSDALNSPPQQLTASIDYRTKPVETDIGAVTASSAKRTALKIEVYGKTPSPSRTEKSSLTAATSPNPKSTTSSTQVIAVADPPLRMARAQNTPRSRFTDLISIRDNLSFWFLFSAALIAAGLGALHALEPGHGKTIVAAYLVGSRGTARHAVLLGLVVTAAHTSGVFLLGAVTLYASRYIVPEQLYPWLGAISGLSVAGLGVFIFLRHLTGESGEHSHAPGEQHSHWFLSIFKQRAFKRSPFEQDAPTPSKESANRADSAASSSGRALSLRELCILGITGGIVPCPAALVVLLSAFSLHRIGFGLFLITAFSLGLAAVLVIVGLTIVYTKRLMSSRVQAGSAALRYLPLVSSAFMVVLGAGITASAIGSVHLGQGLLSGGKLFPFVTVGLRGLFLGVRHSTDPDHVVAVSTIVSRQGSIRSSATIGLLWGLGHTLTIFFVGSAIIIFGVVIPPRLGLSMELSVALMLILLGLLNLTGLMKWITERFTPAKSGFSSSPQTAPDVVCESRDKELGTRARLRIIVNKTVGKLGIYQTIRPLAVGLVHGLAGSAAVALLVLSTIKSPFWATAYLLVFGFGTMIGMMLMTAAISIPVVYTKKTFFNVNRHLAVVSGFASVAFGMFLVYQIGFVDGLFTAHVHWIPN
jgi:ABC-type nickel/cobalt efflux system permease component RcnA/high-affinity nickel permease